MAVVSMVVREVFHSDLMLCWPPIHWQYIDYVMSRINRRNLWLRDVNWWAFYCWLLNQPMIHAVILNLEVSLHYDSPYLMDSHHTVTPNSCMGLVSDVRATKIDYRTMIHCLVALVMVQMKIHLLKERNQLVQFLDTKPDSRVRGWTYLDNTHPMKSVLLWLESHFPYSHTTAEVTLWLALVHFVDGMEYYDVLLSTEWCYLYLVVVSTASQHWNRLSCCCHCYYYCY